MSFVLKDFIDSINEIAQPEVAKVYFNNYSKRNSSRNGDIQVHFSNDQTAKKIKNNFSKLGAVEKYDLTSYHLKIHLCRPTVSQLVIQEILTDQENYGFRIQPEDSSIILDDCVKCGSDLTLMRQELYCQEIKRILLKCGCEIITKNKIQGKANVVECSVGQVEAINSNEIFGADLRKCCSQLLQQSVSEEKRDMDFTSQSILDACLIFNLLLTNPKKKLGICINEDNKNLIKSGSFVMYNYARLASLVEKFDQLSMSGYYPILPTSEHIQYSLLKREDEWLLIRDFLIYFPLLVNEIVTNLYESPNLHKLQHFVLNLSHRVSAYYSKVHILVDPLDHLLPQIFARISLLKAILQIMTNCLFIMNIRPVRKM